MELNAYMKNLREIGASEDEEHENESESDNKLFIVPNEVDVRCRNLQSFVSINKNPKIL